MTEAEDVPKLSAPESIPLESAPVEPPVPESARPLNADGRERPRFLLEFPNDPALQSLVRAFEAGNYQAVRDGARKLADSTEDPIVRAAARELGRRIEPDPLMKYLLFVALCLFVFVVWHTYQGQP
ncbi:MAG TPA: hypothetical protein VER12_03400 [Polyangiaceae bacterium]|nr:hypothetical protein [Polyangiaceae bacterium]